MFFDSYRKSKGKATKLGQQNVDNGICREFVCPPWQIISPYFSFPVFFAPPGHWPSRPTAFPSFPVFDYSEILEKNHPLLSRALRSRIPPLSSSITAYARYFSLSNTQNQDTFCTQLYVIHPRARVPIPVKLEYDITFRMMYKKRKEEKNLNLLVGKIEFSCVCSECKPTTVSKVSSPVILYPEKVLL